MTLTLFGLVEADPAAAVRRKPVTTKLLPPSPADPPALFDEAAMTADEWGAVERRFETALDHLPAVAEKLRLSEAAVTACWAELLALLAPDLYAMPTGSMAGTAADAGKCPAPPDGSGFPGRPK